MDDQCGLADPGRTHDHRDRHWPRGPVLLWVVEEFLQLRQLLLPAGEAVDVGWQLPRRHLPQRGGHGLRRRYQRRLRRPPGQQVGMYPL
jgi:hypothetical protein